MVLFVALGSAAACTREGGIEERRQLVAAARLAQERCYRLIHHDTFAYESCLVELMRGEGKATPKRLGIEYFGWAGAVNSARLGMRGADATAYEFLERFRATQKELGIDDRSLCQSVPGDCDARTARMMQMEASPAPKAQPKDGDNDLATHLHRD